MTGAPKRGGSRAEKAGSRVLVAAHRVAERGGLRIALEAGGFEVSAEAANAKAAVAAAVDTKPDICLIDVDLPGNGIAVAAKISSEAPRTVVVMLANRVREQDLFDSLRAGAVGFLPMGMDPSRLPHALRGVLQGESALPRAFVGRLVDELRERGRRRVAVRHRDAIELTSREWQVLELMQQRLSTKEIAFRLGITQVTVRRHIGSILRKLEVKTREDALALLDETAV